MTNLPLMLLAAASLGAQTITAAADEVPTFDVAATCRGESQGDPDAGVVAACMADEHRARAALVSQWQRFAPESRRNCTQTETGIAGVRSYVELLTCLQMARDVPGLPRE